MSKRQQLDDGVLKRSEWDARTKALIARLRVRVRGVRAVTSEIAHAVWARSYFPDQPDMHPALDPDLDAVIEALRLMPAVRYAVDVDERDLIAAARHLGASWEAIGVALGAAKSGARQTARGRYERLGGDVGAAMQGDAIPTAPTLVDAGERVEASPADDWPLPGEDRGVPGVTFTAPPALFEVDEAGQR